MQAVTPIAAAAPDIVPLLELINTSSDTWDEIIDLANAFPSILVSTDHFDTRYHAGLLLWWYDADCIWYRK